MIHMKIMWRGPDRQRSSEIVGDRGEGGRRWWSGLAPHTLAVSNLATERAGRHLSVRELLDQLAGIEETVLIYPTGGRGRPEACRRLTDTTKTQDQLAEIFGLDRYAPASVIRRHDPSTGLPSAETPSGGT